MPTTTTPVATASAIMARDGRGDVVVVGSIDVGGGGSAGIGASVGIAVAKNLIGYSADGRGGEEEGE